MNVFVLRNQQQLYLSKQKSWVTGKENQGLWRSEHHDEALNTLIELNAKDIELRGDILDVSLDDKRQPIVEVSDDAVAYFQTQQEAAKALLESSDDSQDELSLDNN